MAASRIAFHIDAEAENSRLMPKQALRFGRDKRLRGLIEREVNAAQQQLRISV